MNEQTRKNLAQNAINAARVGDAAAYNRAVAELFNRPLARYYEDADAALQLPHPENSTGVRLTVTRSDNHYHARCDVFFDGAPTITFYVHKRTLQEALGAAYAGAIVRCVYHEGTAHAS